MILHSRPWIEDADIAAVAACLASDMIASGHLAQEFENRLAERYCFAEAIVVGSGCQAILLALRGLRIGTGDRVVLPTYVCPEVLGVVESIGAEPVLADVDEGYGIDGNDPVFAGATPAAVLAPSLFGFETKFRHGAVPVIHDWAQYLPPAGPAGSGVEIAVMSFGATKPLSAGEGGAILVRDPALARAIRQQKCVAGSDIALNLYPFSDIQAALALSQLDRLDEMISRRRAIAAGYEALAMELGGIETSAMSPRDVPFRLPMRLSPARLAQFGGTLDPVLSQFARRGIVARRPVAGMLHHLRAVDRDFPVAERLFASTLSLPIYPALAAANRNRITAAIREVLR